MSLPQLGLPTDPNFLTRVKEWIEIRDGNRGNGEKRFVEFEDLHDSSFINSLSSYQCPITKVNPSDGRSGDTIPPNQPTSFAVTENAFSNTLTWVDPTDSDLYYIEIYSASVTAGAAAPAVSSATMLAHVGPGQEYFDDTLIDLEQDYYYWVRAVDYTGNFSGWANTTKAVGESVESTISKLMDMLKGASPDTYNAGTTYYEDDQVYFSTTGKNYICKNDNGGAGITGQDPADGDGDTNSTYWKRHGFLVTGDVDGVSVVGVDGTMVVDGTILARSISVTDLSAINADIGTITAGTLSSSDWAAAAGMRLDLDNKWLKMGGSNVTAAGAAAGVFLGLDTSYKFYVGDGSNSYMKYDGSNLTLSIDSANALVIKNGGDIFIEGGGDVVMTPHDSAPSTIQWDTGSVQYYIAAGATTTRGLCLYTDSSQSGYLIAGLDPAGNQRRFTNIELYAKIATKMESKYDSTHLGSVGTGADGSNGYCFFEAQDGATSYELIFDGNPPAFRPWNDDNAIDIGSASYRFKDLRLGGSAYVGGDVYMTDDTYIGISGNERLVFDASGFIEVTGAHLTIQDGKYIGIEGNERIVFDASGAIEVNGANFGTADGHISVPDDYYFRCGNENDLIIYHDGNNSYIDNVTGTLYLRASTNENAFAAVPNSYTYLYYDGSWKFRTESAGAVFNATQISFDSSNLNTWLYDSAAATGTLLRLYSSSGSYGCYTQYCNSATGYTIVSDGFVVGINGAENAVYQQLETNLGHYWYANGAYRVVIDVNGIYPYTDSSVNCGDSSYCWSNVYADAGVTSCSDRKYKTEVKGSELGLDFIMDLDVISWRFRQDMGKNHYRVYHGMLAQDVLSTLEKCGYDYDYFGGIVINDVCEHDSKIKNVDDKYNTDRGEKIGENYGLIYEQFIGPLILSVQETNQKLETEISNLKKDLELLKAA